MKLTELKALPANRGQATLRDEFAIRIFAAMVSNDWAIVGDDAKNTSEIAYAAADAMLAERAK